MKSFFSINFTQIFRICPKMFQFLTYFLPKQIIEMCRSQNLRCPFSVPSRRHVMNKINIFFQAIFAIVAVQFNFGILLLLWGCGDLLWKIFPHFGFVNSIVNALRALQSGYQGNLTLFCHTLQAILFYKKRSFKKQPIKFFNHKKQWPIEFSKIRNNLSY